jgi:hypothetical protein
MLQNSYGWLSIVDCWLLIVDCWLSIVDWWLMTRWMIKIYWWWMMIKIYWRWMIMIYHKIYLCIETSFSPSINDQDLSKMNDQDLSYDLLWDELSKFIDDEWSRFSIRFIVYCKMNDQDLSMMNDWDFTYDFLQDQWSWFIEDEWLRFSVWFIARSMIKIYWWWMLMIHWGWMIEIFHEIYLCIETSFSPND